jgi:hypothetical protein
LLACRPAPESAPARPHIDLVQARRLVLEKYRALFTRKYFRLDDEYHEFPPLSEAHFKRVVLKSDAWDVRCEPLAGHYVIGRVGLTGDWVELNQVGFANQ